MLFYTLCVPSRLLYAYVQNTYPQFWWINLIIATYFLYAFLIVKKGFFTKIPWWNNMRLVHSIIFFIAVFYPPILFFDVALGIGAKLIHQYQ